jgi:hypothetical protein
MKSQNTLQLGERIEDIEEEVLENAEPAVSRPKPDLLNLRSHKNPNLT